MNYLLGLLQDQPLRKIHTILQLCYHKFQLKFVEGIAMSYQIDELLKQSEYNIYNNPKVSDEKIEKIAKVISDDKKKQIKEKVKIASNKM